MAERLTPARLADFRQGAEQSGMLWPTSNIRALLAHIDAQEAELELYRTQLQNVPHRIPTDSIAGANPK